MSLELRLVLSDFTTFFKRQNVGLFIDTWALRQCQTTPFMVWHVDPEFVQALEALDFQPYFSLGRVTSTAPAYGPSLRIVRIYP